jgi:hypothetical protein
MKLLRLILPALLLFALTSLSFGADLNGKWKGDLKMQDGSNLETSFVFKVDGEKLTGTVTNTFGEEQITEGVVKGEEVSFVILAGGGQFRIVYKGKLTGDDLKLTVTVGDFGDQEMVAKRTA